METFLRIGVGNAVVATLFALVAAAAGRLVARRPAVRHGLWLLVLFKLITPPLEIVDVGWLSPSRPPELEAGATSALDTAVPVEIDEVPAIESDAASVQVAEPAPLFEPLRAVVPLLATLWVLGSLVTLSVVAVRIARWNRILADLKPASDAVCDDVAELAMPMGLRTPPSVWWTPGSSTPLVWAFFCNARLIIPGQLWSRLDQDQRTTLLIHELAHLRRRDHWVRPIELVVAIVYWWLPTAWIARRALREAEEQCCDAWVVWLCPKAAVE